VASTKVNRNTRTSNPATTGHPRAAMINEASCFINFIFRLARRFLLEMSPLKAVLLAGCGMSFIRKRRNLSSSEGLQPARNWDLHYRLRIPLTRSALLLESHVHPSLTGCLPARHFSTNRLPSGGNHPAYLACQQ
jgi:hypothetical protein